MSNKQVLDSMAATKEFVANKIAEFQAELNQAGRKQPSTIAALNTEFLSFKNMVCSALDVLQSQVNMLIKGQDRLEMHSRRKMLLVHGIPEEKSEDISSRLVSIMSSKMPSVALSSASIRTCHRMGALKPDSKGKPRHVLIKFTDSSARDKIWFGKKALKSTGITLSEFLTKSRHDAFMAARDKYGIKNCWTQNGWIHIKTAGGVKCKIESKDELDVLVAGQSS
ncbi:hypothetical protein NE865_06586 [Phthorimaea operculella]|nr:hypothetical protein NE865_06586 [Phthorimaea operculella]